MYLPFPFSDKSAKSTFARSGINGIRKSGTDSDRYLLQKELNIRCENQDLGVVKAKKSLYLNL
ncbi:MAG: hypothetical protein V7K69_27755 [Nostoc sp.]|uniref:hypothetical protein n=1 Tax=Nostoc sp. TaxID=1180 RepID=UPI002FF97951